jgi:hypothetical protein
LISRPREPLVLFLDESLDSDSIAQALIEAGAKVERLTRHLPRGTPDEEWLALRAGTAGSSSLETSAFDTGGWNASPWKPPKCGPLSSTAAMSH